MDFSLSAKQLEIRQRVKLLCSRLDLANLPEREQRGEFGLSQFQLLADLGVNEWMFPAAVGGEALSAQELVSALEYMGELCEDTGLIFGLAAHLCACVHPLVAYGSVEQLSLWGRRIRQLGWLGAHAITEPEAGSDVYAMQTTASKVDGGYILHGRKCYITNAPVADFLLLHARTGQQGNIFDFSTFLLPVDAAGVQLSKVPREKVGLRTAAMGDIRLEQVFVEDNGLLGQAGSGLPMFQAAMGWERTCLFALFLGVMKQQLDSTVRHCQSRQQFDRPLSEQQSVSHQLVDMYSRYETARLAIYKAAWSLDQGQGAALASCLAKIQTAEAAVSNSLTAIKLHGALGIVQGQIERMHRDLLATSVFSGSNDTLRNNAARLLLQQHRQQSMREE